MSSDYSTGKPTRFANVTFAAAVGAGAGVNATFIFSQYDFLALMLLARVITAAATADATIQLQASDATGVAGWTTIGSIVIPTTAVAGAVIQSRVPESTSFVSVASALSPGVPGARRCLRLNGTGTTTALIYDLEVFTTSRHE